MEEVEKRKKEKRGGKRMKEEQKEEEKWGKGRVEGNVGASKGD